MIRASRNILSSLCEVVRFTGFRDSRIDCSDTQTTRRVHGSVTAHRSHLCKDTTVAIDAQTKVLGDAKVGDVVQVIANVDSGHNYIAIAIIKTQLLSPPEPVAFAVSGTVKTISATR